MKIATVRHGVIAVANQPVLKFDSNISAADLLIKLGYKFAGLIGGVYEFMKHD